MKIDLKIGMVPYDEEMRESHSRKFGHEQMGMISISIRNIKFIQVGGTKKVEKYILKNNISKSS